jgi:predicted Fe-Mo cluster-binding NifX family protein
MRIAIPVADGQLAMHFGHCEKFALIDADLGKKSILGTEEVPAPEHEPGLLPRWLRDQGAKLVIAGGMGHRAQAFFAEYGITVLTGAPAGPAADIAQAWLDGHLETGPNVCAH